MDFYYVSPNNPNSLFLTMTLSWIASLGTFLKYDITRSYCVASLLSNNGRLLISCHGFRSKLPKYIHPSIHPKKLNHCCAFRGTYTPSASFLVLSSLIFINTTRVIAALMFVYTFFFSPVIYTRVLRKTKHIKVEHPSSSNGQARWFNFSRNRRFI